LHVKTITYTDYNGEKRTEDFYFNLSKADILELEMSVAGGMSELLRRIVASKDARQIMEIFKDIIVKSYGVKSPDGRRFEKSKEIAEQFLQTEAYSEFMMELITDPEFSVKFIKEILPGDFPDQLLKAGIAAPPVG